MSEDIFFDKMKEETEEISAMAVVVRREAPTSGKPGDKAIITQDGNVKGWIGGGCTKGIVIKEALAAIKEQTPRLVRIHPSDNLADQEGVKNYKMTCMSGGSVDVYIEPIMPVSKLRIFGRSHIAVALCNIATAAGFEVNVVTDLAEDEMFTSAKSVQPLKGFESKPAPGEYTVVCTQGENDANSLLAAVQMNPRYLAFVASRKKANSILMGLKRQDVPHEQLVKIKTPAGIDINAKTPEEVAISILAEIIREKRNGESSSNNIMQEEKELQEDLYINPVCKIPVQKSTAKYILEYEGEKVYFCCDGCKESFEKDPAAYMTP